jgi:hypothetical protein
LTKLSYKHCEYQSFEYLQVPAEQHFGPFQPKPPHCPHIPEHVPVPAEEVVEVAKVVDVLELVVVVVTGGCEVLGTLVVEAVLVLTEVPASRALRMAV